MIAMLVPGQDLPSTGEVGCYLHVIYVLGVFISSSIISAKKNYSTSDMIGYVVHIIFGYCREFTS